MKRLFTLAAVLITLIPLNAQRFRTLRQFELKAGVGISNTLSELGGANRIGTHFYRDFEIAMTRPAANLGLRMYIPDTRWAGSFNISYARVAGNDKLTRDPYRENRNLNFRSPIVEFSVQAEFYFRKAQSGKRYQIREVVGSKTVSMDWYVFAGIGGFWFNPKGWYNGNWYALQPLSTEGQGVVATRKKYNRFTGCIPLGVGGKYHINNNLSVGFEMGFRYTFTDYLDDVSTSYIDPTVLANSKGELAANIANPSLTDQNGQTLAGEQRGDPRHNDVYMMMLFNVNYKFGSGFGKTPLFSPF